MTGRTAATGKRPQLDLFIAFGDVPFRDERDGMSVPLVSLSSPPAAATRTPPGAG